MIKNTQNRYGAVSMVLHWASALVVIGLFGLGFWMVELTYYSSWYQTAPALHKSMGILLLLATVVRLMWRWGNPKPLPLPQHKRWEKRLSSWVHALLYLLLMAIFASGYLISTADGRSIPVFELLELPSMGELFAGQADIAGLVHQYLAYSLIGLVIVHALGAIKHHIIDKDSTLIRMTTFKEIK